MKMSKYITEGSSILESFPYSLARDDDKGKLAASVSDEIARLMSDTDNAAIFARIEKLDEPLLDLLAIDFKVEWYETAAPIKNKRLAIKECILVHKYKGTKFAVEAAVHSLYDRADVEEWFEYGGEPYHFRIMVFGSSSGGTKVLSQKILYAKNLRSVLDTVEFILVPDRNLEAFVGVVHSGRHKYIAGEIISTDETIYKSKPAEISIGMTNSGKHKRISAEVNFATDYGAVKREISANAAATLTGRMKRIVKNLNLPSPADLQTATSEYAFGARANVKYKIIKVEVNIV